MNLTAEQKQIASLLAARYSKLAATGSDKVTIFAEMADYMPGFKCLLDTSTRSEMDALCEQHAGLYVMKTWRAPMSVLDLPQQQ